MCISVTRLLREGPLSRTVTPRELEHMKASVTLFDVRRRADYDVDPEMIPGATWRDPDRVDDWARDIAADAEVVIYCVRGGSVSNAVLDQLLARNLHARYVEGGFVAWKGAGRPTETKASRA